MANYTNRLGFCVRYDAITRYKQFRLMNKEIADILERYFSGFFTQRMVNNMDYNPATLHVKGSQFLLNQLNSLLTRFQL